MPTLATSLALSLALTVALTGARAQAQASELGAPPPLVEESALRLSDGPEPERPHPWGWLVPGGVFAAGGLAATTVGLAMLVTVECSTLDVCTDDALGVLVATIGGGFALAGTIFLVVGGVIWRDVDEHNARVRTEGGFSLDPGGVSLRF